MTSEVGDQSTIGSPRIQKKSKKNRNKKQKKPKKNKILVPAGMERVAAALVVAVDVSSR